jgi:arylsulfatase A-like enzyme
MGPLAVAVVAVVLWGIARGTRPANPKERPDILLISIDTLRADRLGCFGYRDAQTPHIDRLADEGVVFESATAPVPITLPSHASMLTGLIPPEHGVRLNSGYRLPESIRTLAEVLNENGYQTGGFIAGLPMVAANGLAQGFDFYDDELSRKSGADAPVKRNERWADAVLASAAKWLDSTDSNQPVFAFVHIFDPHRPYEKAIPGSSTNSYDGEIAYVDRELGGFMSGLGKSSRWEGMLTVLTSDHGESLDEHGELTHGLFVYESTLHVPLIISRPGVIKPRRVTTPVGIIDIPATILALAGLSGIAGESIVPFIENPDAQGRPIYFESLVSSLRCGWAPLRGIRIGHLKYISAPKPELYDLKTDPKEVQNLYTHRPDDAAHLAEQLAGIDEGHLAVTDVDEETIEQLAGLGYISATLADPSDGDRSVDPKDRIEVYERLQSAHRDYLARRYDEALGTMEAIESYFPQSPLFYLRYGDYAMRTGDWPLANSYYKKSVSNDPTNQTALFNLAVSYHKCGESEEGLRRFEAVLRINPDHMKARRCAGDLCVKLGRPPEEAIAHLTRFLELAPNHPAAEQARKTIARLTGG